LDRGQGPSSVDVEYATAFCGLGIRNPAMSEPPSISVSGVTGVLRASCTLNIICATSTKTSETWEIGGVGVSISYKFEFFDALFRMTLNI
jgi:hypothetical protein